MHVKYLVEADVTEDYDQMPEMIKTAIRDDLTSEDAIQFGVSKVQVTRLKDDKFFMAELLKKE